MPKINTAGRDILPYTQTKDPDSPIFGGSQDYKKKIRGVQELKIDRDEDDNDTRGNYGTDWIL
jgi:hypothetical protein